MEIKSAFIHRVENNSSHISLLKCLFAKCFSLSPSPSPCSIIQLEFIIENACTSRVCVSSHWKWRNIFSVQWLSLTSRTCLKPCRTWWWKNQGNAKNFSLQRTAFQSCSTSLSNLMIDTQPMYFCDSYSLIHYPVSSLTLRRHSVAAIYLHSTPFYPNRRHSSPIFFLFYEPRQTEMNF